MKTYPLPIYLQRFFTEKLNSQLNASPNTIASYRDTFRLLLKYVSANTGHSPTELIIENIDVEQVGNFLSFIENKKKNSISSRNTRLSAIKSFFKYVADNEPQILYHCQKILAIPSKRGIKREINYLEHFEINALLKAPDISNWYGRRDYTILLLAVQTGLRVSELINLKCRDIALGTGAHVKCLGKGRKNRSTPLRKECVGAIQNWLHERLVNPSDPLFVNNRGDCLSRDSIERIVKKYTTMASSKCPTLKNKRVTPHVLRHSSAMQLLQNGVDCTLIALWLGHESVETTQRYIHADIKLKEQALEKTKPLSVQKGRYKPNDELLAFLEAL
jgi:integrase/recombinase XerD